MESNKLSTVYFSATGTTAKIVSAIAQGFSTLKAREYKIITPCTEHIIFSHNETVIFGVPVFSGRVPTIAMKSLSNFSGSATPAIIVCVYGNREVDDALLELKNSVEQRGFKVISAAAFVAQHSIFPVVAAGRPNTQDIDHAHQFGHISAQWLYKADDKAFEMPLEVTGNYPYRPVKKIPLIPQTDKNCNSCGLCVKQCPVGAIDSSNPHKTNKELCISCAHCVAICPKKSRHFSGLLYRMAARKFTKANTMPKEPYIVFRER
ncbi:MAG: 4Fe-4S binding protein [Mucinivorans sp.]